jgi:hypothetical protein
MAHVVMRSVDLDVFSAVGVSNLRVNASSTIAGRNPLEASAKSIFFTHCSISFFSNACRLKT